MAGIYFQDDFQNKTSKDAVSTHVDMTFLPPGPIILIFYNFDY